MKNSKVMLALLLAFVMLFSAFGVFAADTTTTTTTTTTEPAATTTPATTTTTTATTPADATASFSDVAVGTTVGDAVTKLVAYGIIAGYPDGTFKPDGEITRAEFAAVIARFNGIADSFGEDAVTGFSDLDSDTSRGWAKPFVKAAVDAKIINGFEDGSFRAAEPVTYEQAVKMIICAIEYGPIAESELARLKITDPTGTTWSSGYIATANKNNITKGAISANVTAGASRGTVAVLVSNALDAPKLKIVTDSNGKVSYQKDEGTISDNKYDAKEKVEGYVSGTYYTGIDKQFPDISKVELNITTSDGEKTYELSSSLQSSIDLENIFGRRVLAYYSKDTEQLVSITDKSDETIRINEQDIQSISGDTVKYLKDGKNASESLGGYTFIYNGKYAPGMTLDDINPETGRYPLLSGYIELVTSSYAKVAKVVSYQVFVANNFDKTNEKIYFRYNQTYNGENFYLFPQQTSAKPDIYVVRDGKATKTEFDSLSLTQYDVINMMQSMSGAEGNAINKMYITKGVKSGKVSSTSSEEREIEMGDTTYYLTNSYLNYEKVDATDEDKAPFDLDESYSFYLDYMGLIAAVKYSAASAGTYKFGYIMSAGKLDNDYVVRMIDQDGKDIKYTLKSTVKIDGNKKKDSDVIDALATTAAAANAAYNSVATWNTEHALSGTYFCQPVRYSLSGSLIETIDTVVQNDATDVSDSFSYDRKLSGTTKINGTTSLGSGDDAFGADADTKVFYIPDNRADYSSYSKMNNTKAFTNGGKMYIEAFNIDDTSVTKRAKMILVFKQDPSLAFISSSSFMIVTKTYVEGDNNIIEGYKNGLKGEPAKLVVSDDRFITDDIGTVKCSEATAVEKGDLIRYLTNASGEAIAINLWYDASNPAQLETVSTDKDARALRVLDGFSSSSYNYRYGMPILIDPDEKTLLISYRTTTDDAALNPKEQTSALWYKVTSSTILYEYSAKDGVKIIETIDSIYDMSVDTPSRVIVFSTNDSTSNPNNLRMIYVIND